jgi:hypothetical protein
MKKNKFIFIFLAAIFIFSYGYFFRNFFLDGELVFGDAPNFSPSLLENYLGFPQMWRQRIGPFGGLAVVDSMVNLVMNKYAFLSQLGLDNKFIVRILFFFPATLFSIIGSYLLSGIFVKNKASRLVTSLLYTFNTYFLLLIDGGQVGVALGYGISPIVLWFLLKRKFLPSLIGFWLLTNIEIRFAAIVAVTFIILEFFISFPRFKIFLKNIIPFGAVVVFALLLDYYWIAPILTINRGLGLAPVFSDLNLVKMENALYLFQPHWSLNEFGKVFLPNLRFFLLPLLIFYPAIFKKDKITLSITLTFLLSIFLAKGGNTPFGSLYTWGIQNFPFGEIFRDSSKFFLPALITASILIGKTSEILMKSDKFGKLWLIVIPIYLLITIIPTSLSGILGQNKPVETDIERANNLISENNSLQRTVFFPKRPSGIVETYPASVIDGDGLYKYRPYASLIEGTYDKFMFIWDPLFEKLADFSGIGFVFFTKDERNKDWTEKEIIEREQFVASASANINLPKLNGFSFPAFRVPNITPRVFMADKVLLVVGGDEILRDLYSDEKRLRDIPIVFAEDGFWDVKQLLNVDKNSLNILFNGKEKSDLVYRLLSGGVLTRDDVIGGDWGQFGDIVDYRYEARKRGIDLTDLDFGKGIVYSNINGEKIDWKIDLSNDTEINLIVRGIDNGEGFKLLIDDGEIGNYSFSNAEGFEYLSLGMHNLVKGEHRISLVNTGGFIAVNFLRYYTDVELNEASGFTDEILSRFLVVEDLDQGFPRDNSYDIDFSKVAETKYKFTAERSGWVISTDAYNENWIIGDSLHVPVFSFVNGFYISGGGEKEIYFKGQDAIGRGFKLSLTTAFVIIVLGGFYARKFLRKNKTDHPFRNP